MSLLAFATAATLGATPVHAPVHRVDMDHRGSTYQVDYRAHVETRMRSIGMSAPTRPSNRRCLITADVSVERVIVAGQGGHALKSMLPQDQSFTSSLPGGCQGREAEAARLVQNKAGAIDAHLASAAASDSHAALAAIESAHHFAAN
ncbi:hypothetical protein ABVV53_02050 [Novosphingobium sp. RD2P27]|uniref:UrcA family protein n=1 Tax=Novosphingobium kalidii TaxID=3230299 RepID=A0ABV2CXB9_9SPHN